MTDEVRLNLEMSGINISGNSVVSKTRLRHWRRPHLCVDGEWSGIDISGSFALVARLLVLKLLGNRDGVSDGRLAYSTSPKIFPSHKMPLANSTS